MLVFTGLFSIPTNAQVNDAGLWISLNVEKKISRSFSATLSQEFRMNENCAELGTFFTDIGLSFKINKNLKVSGSYRIIEKRRLDDSYSLRHRYYFDLSYREKFKPVVLQYRLRFQSQYKDVYSSSDGMIPEYYLRNKITVKLDLDKKFEPYIYSELFTPLNKPDGIYIDNIRYCAGFEYKLNRMHSFDLFYMIQKEYNVSNPETDYILGIGYNFCF